jgi:hypothetical protein
MGASWSFISGWMISLEPHCQVESNIGISGLLVGVSSQLSLIFSNIVV